jgi:hypothetical protein
MWPTNESLFHESILPERHHLPRQLPRRAAVRNAVLCAVRQRAPQQLALVHTRREAVRGDWRSTGNPALLFPIGYLRDYIMSVVFVVHYLSAHH